MDNALDLDTLTGKTVSQAFALHDLEFGWLLQVLFQVEQVWLQIAVNEDTDEIILATLKDLNLGALEQQYSLTQISNQRKEISQLWRMTNQQGYEDGFQVEFDDMDGTCVQLLAEASQLRLAIFQRYR